MYACVRVCDLSTVLTEVDGVVFNRAVVGVASDGRLIGLGGRNVESC